MSYIFFNDAPFWKQTHDFLGEQLAISSTIAKKEGRPGAHLSCAGLRLGGPAAGGQAGEQEHSHCSPQRTHLHRWGGGSSARGR